MKRKKSQSFVTAGGVGNPTKYFSHLPKGLSSRWYKANGGPEATRTIGGAISLGLNSARARQKWERRAFLWVRTHYKCKGEKYEDESEDRRITSHTR